MARPSHPFEETEITARKKILFKIEIEEKVHLIRKTILKMKDRSGVDRTRLHLLVP